MVKILFVDDEPMLLNALRMALRRLRKVWDMRFVESGAAALAELACSSADVVVSDQNMPGMRGTDLLEQVRTRFPQSLRMLLSGQSDGAGLHDGLRVAHQFLLKPCNLDDLTVAVNHLLDLKASFDNPAMQRVIHAVDKLPTPKAVFAELGRLLNDPDSDLKVIGHAAECDPALSLRLMKLANSAFYAQQPVSEVTRAVQRLGISMVRSAVTYAQVMSTVEASLGEFAPLVEVMQQRALTIGNLGLKLLPGEAGRQAYLAGLLSDVGGLVLLGSLPEHRDALFRGNPWPCLRATRERETLGFTHAQVGAYLLGTWGQPAALVRAVAQQHAPTVDEDKLFGVVGAVHVAERLAMEQEAKLKNRPERAEYDIAYLGACGQTLPALTARAFGSEAR